MKHTRLVSSSLFVDQYLLYKKICKSLPHEKLGPHHLMLGLDSQSDTVLAHKLRTKLRTFTATETQKNAPLTNRVADYCMLPFADASTSCVILQHCNTQQTDSNQLLREIWRILEDDGTLVMILAHTPQFLHRNHTLRKESGYSLRRVTDTLCRHLFVIKSVEKCFYTPTFFRHLPLPSLAARLCFTSTVDNVSAFVCPVFAGIVLVCAQKQIIQPIHQKIGKPSKVLTPSTSPSQ